MSLSLANQMSVFMLYYIGSVVLEEPAYHLQPQSKRVSLPVGSCDRVDMGNRAGNASRATIE